MPARPALCAIAGLLALPVGVSAGAEPPSPVPEAVLAGMRAAHLEPERAARVKGVRLQAALATFTLSDGVLFPLSAVNGKSVELVFLGRGRVSLDPPDEIERGQLELFTGATRLDRDFEDAVLVVGMAEAVAGLLRSPAGPVEPGMAARAEALYAEWKKRRERELLDVDRAILLDALGEPSFQGYFAAWLRGGALAGVTYVVEPGAREQVTLGRFVPLDADEKERRQIAKRIRREQRKGRLVGVEVEDLGQWDTWVSTALRGADGRPSFGYAAFEPERYRLDVTIGEKAARLEGRATVELRPAMTGARSILFSLPRDLEVRRVSDAAGAPLFFHRSEQDLTVLLPAAPRPDEHVAVTIDYAGSGIEKDGNLYTNLSTIGWYPHAGTRDRAPYELTLHWPRSLDVVASGTRVEGGEEPGARRWERRTLAEPTAGVSFEVGHYRTETRRVGHVEVMFAFGSGTALTGRELRHEVMDIVGEALLFYEKTFGPYPLDGLTVCTASRGYSQGLLGFVTLSDSVFTLPGFWARLLGVTDRRQEIAHEVAHQWWGDQMGWVGYRDQWMSEALASYSAGLFTEKQSPEERSGADLLQGWRDDLTSTLADGRPLESAGPVVLGARLLSSRAEAYTAIVYEKGALVMGLLARTVGKEVFPRALTQVLRAAKGREITTEQFLDLLHETTGAEFAPLARRFVFGTGLPQLFYDYRFEPRGPGGWIVRGSIRQASPLLWSHRVVRTANGWDVVRSARAQIADFTTPLLVPVEVALRDPQKPKGKGPSGSNSGLGGNLVLAGEETPLALEVDLEPTRFWVDPKSRSLTLPLDVVRAPFETSLLRGIQAAAAGRATEAQDWFNRAEQAEDALPDDREGVYYQQIQEGRRIQRARVELARARLNLDQGDDTAAAAALDRAQGPLADEDRELRLLRARLEVRRGDYERAFRRLRKPVIEQHLKEAEAAALLAIAARETGHAEEERKALRVASDAIVDLGEFARR